MTKRKSDVRNRLIKVSGISAGSEAPADFLLQDIDHDLLNFLLMIYGIVLLAEYKR